MRSNGIEMPKYTYMCKSCNTSKEFNLPVDKFIELSKNSYFNDLPCDKCGTIPLLRKISAPFGSVEKRREEIVQKAKEEARIITNKIREGDQGAIRDIFGEDS